MSDWRSALLGAAVATAVIGAACTSAPAAPTPVSKSAATSAPAATAAPAAKPIAAASAVSAPTPGLAVTSAPTSGDKIAINVAIAPSAVTHLTYWVAVYNGFFDKNGLKANVVSGATGAAMAQLLVSGQINFALTDIPSVSLLNAQGADVKIVDQILDSGAFQLLCHPGLGITPGYPDGLKTLEGHSIGVGSIGVGSGTELNPRFSLVKAGVDPEKVKWVAVGAVANYVAAYQSNQVDCVSAYQPIPTLLKSGPDAPTLILDWAKEGPPEIQGYATYMVATDGKYAAANPEAIKRFRQAIKDSISFIKDSKNHEAIAAAVLPGFPGIDQPTMLDLVRFTATTGYNLTAPEVTQRNFDDAFTVWSTGTGNPKPAGVTLASLMVP